ncbi:restriction endonuclease [Lactococcus paracarnosus]|uniref:restriction endonuclease n=1 Tax=Pseudolactococcus paracarnosus TaxID=2749962 RepID=UPI001FB978D4|nr:restriction endonuclease [Lactococcus paracarnosus]MCJ1998683.1 hypothetical protein [Lactococcus paracarnosus]
MSFKEIYFQVSRNKKLIVEQNELIENQKTEIEKLKNQKLELNIDIQNYKKKENSFNKSFLEFEVKKQDYEIMIKDNFILKREHDKNLLRVKVSHLEIVALEDRIVELKNIIIDKNIEISSLDEIVEDLSYKIDNFEKITDNGKLRDFILDNKNLPIFYKSILIYNSDNDLKKYFSNFVKKYTNETFNFIMPDIDDRLNKYLNGEKIALTAFDNYSLETNNSLKFCDDVLIRFIELLHSKDLKIQLNNYLVVEFVKFEVIKQIFLSMKDEINISKIKTNNTKDFFYSCFNYFTENELKQFNVIAFISYYCFEHRILVDNYKNLDDFYKIQQKYYKDFEFEKLDSIISADQVEVTQTNYLDKIDFMDGFEFERFLSTLFLKLGFKRNVTKKTGDQGADLIVDKDGVSYAVQAKRYSSPVGNKAVQEAISGKAYYETNHAMVVTTSHYTRQAQELARKSGVILWNRDKLFNIIKEAYKENALD